MLSPKMQDALNRQINVEFFSAYSYLALSAWFEAKNLKGFAHWMRVQYQEERVHAIKIYDFVHARDGEVELLPIAAPPRSWTTPLQAFEHALESERNNSAKIYELVEQATVEHDHATGAFLHWFVNEQVEEEAITKQIVDQLELVGESNTGLFMLDQQLGQRSPEAEAADEPGE